MLGSDLVPAFRKAFGDENVIAMGRADLDITDEKAVFETIRKIKPEVVVNAAAYTNVDGAEKEREAAHRINVLGPTYLSQACREYGVRLVHFSTDQVFGGDVHHPRTEDESTSPLNYYAATKLMGEKAVLTNPNSLVVRVQWLYGKKKDRFTILKDKKEFSPFADQIGCPTWTKHVAEATAELVLRRSIGVFHFAYDDSASWAEVFQFVKDTMGYQVELRPKLTAELNLPARRPLFSALSNKKLVSVLKRAQLGSWRDALKEFLKLQSL